MRAQRPTARAQGNDLGKPKAFPALLSVKLISCSSVTIVRTNFLRAPYIGHAVLRVFRMARAELAGVRIFFGILAAAVHVPLLNRIR
jgi:hypothetical protein